LYSGSDGQSHIEAVDLSQTPDWGAGLAASQISFRESPVGNFQDWHPAPRRQFVIILSGQLEIGLGDGSKHVFGPGDARLVEDTELVDRGIELIGINTRRGSIAGQHANVLEGRCADLLVGRRLVTAKKSLVAPTQEPYRSGFWIGTTTRMEIWQPALTRVFR